MIAAGENFDLLVRHREILTSLARLDPDTLHLATALHQKPEQSVAEVIAGGTEIYLPLAGMIDLDAEVARWQKEVADLEKRIAASKGKLNNPNFVQKAPIEVVGREREKLADLELQAAKIWDRLKELG
jgi:valyl-tRNA synthetase